MNTRSVLLLTVLFFVAIPGSQAWGETSPGEEAVFPRIELPSTFGSASFGVIYDTNANFGPSHKVIRLNASDTALSPGARPEDDLQYYGSLFLNHRHELSRGATLESTLFAIQSFAVELSDRHFGALEGRSGVRFSRVPGLPELALKPFVLLARTESGADSETRKGGLGLSGSRPLTEKLMAESELLYWVRDNRLEDSPDSSVRTLDASGRLRYTASLSTSFSAFGGFAHSRSRQVSSHYDQFRLGGAVIHSFRPSFARGPASWSVIGSAFHLWSKFPPDPGVDASARRRDHSWQLSLSGSVPLSARWSLLPALSYTTVDANLPNYEFDNLGVQFGVSYSF